MLVEELNSNFKTTPAKLVEAGLKVCDSCGALNPLENSECAECSEIIVMFVDRN